jgi:hypothetical protein
VDDPDRLLQFEMYSTVPCAPDELWALVGDLRRLPEWTDADHVHAAPEPPVEVGARFATETRGDRLDWVVITSLERLVEIKTDDLPAGRFGVGVSAVPDPLGARLILAGMLDPARSTLRARLVDLPALRARLDRWSDLAVRALGGG